MTRARNTRNQRPTGRIRLQKYMSDAGVASRRDAEEMIIEGRVLVNGEVVDTLPAFVDPSKDDVIVDGARVKPQRVVYCVLNKPANVVVAAQDPTGRRLVYELLPEVFGRVFPVGRMDAETAGTLFLTNDSELAARLGDPYATITAQYQVEVKGHATPQLINRLRQGLFLAEGKATIIDGEVRHATRERSMLWIELRERINRQLRRMLAQLGFPVRKLIRLAYGPLKIKGLPNGASRELASAEVAMLHRLAEQRDEAQPKLKNAPVRGKPRPGQVVRGGEVATAPPVAAEFEDESSDFFEQEGEFQSPRSQPRSAARSTSPRRRGGDQARRGADQKRGARAKRESRAERPAGGGLPSKKPSRRVIS